MSKKIKFFFGQSQFYKFEKVKENKRKFGFFFSVIFLICFKTGLTVLNFLIYVKKYVFKLVAVMQTIAISDFKKTQVFFSARLKKLVTSNYPKSTGVFFVLIFIGFLGFIGLKFVASAFNIKKNVFVLSKQALIQLENAKNSIKQEDFASSHESFNLAAKTFQTAQNQLEYSQLSLQKILNLIPQKQQTSNLLLAARLLSEAGGDFVSAATEMKLLSFTQSGFISKKPFVDIFKEVSLKLNSADSKTTQAWQIISHADIGTISKNYAQLFFDSKEAVQSAAKGLSSLKSTFELFSSILIGEKSLLFIFENNNELRPTGGFIGTFGNLKIKNGQISKIHISSVYDLDGQLSEKIRPPTPILNVNSRWFMRDSNWFSDFKESAKKVSQFYEKEGGETPDIVVALTPNLIVDLLKITGPVNLPKYNLTLDFENFIEQTQIASSNSENQNSPNSPKQILADFFSIFIQKLSELPDRDWIVAIESLQNSLTSKQLLAYAKSLNIQQQLEAFNWAGRILDTDGDFLQIVSANLGGSKTDLFIQQTANLKVSVDENGNLINELSVQRKNTLPDFEYSKNLSYIRIYTPLGSQLLANEGFDFKSIDSIGQKNIKTDADVLELEKKSVRDVVSGTTIGIESGKTVFGNWLEVKGGQTKIFKLTYKLPFKLGEIDKYSLLIQKQAGSLSMPLNFVLEFPNRKLHWLNSQPEKVRDEYIEKNIYLNHDDFFGAVLSKNDN